jgi:hypothetical protein
MDEFHELVTPSVVPILTGTRKFRLGLVASHHSLKQLHDADAAVADALLANAATRVVFRVSDEDAKRLADGFTDFDAAALRSLAVGHAVCRVERADRDFNLATRPSVTVQAADGHRRRERAIAESRARYTAPQRPQPQSPPDEPDEGEDDEHARDPLDRLYDRLSRGPERPDKRGDTT